MRILWDFRLFSYGYANRGVGKYTCSITEALIQEIKDADIYILADKESTPEPMHSWPVKWIKYKPASWKHDLYYIPYIIKLHKIDIFHYWIALGPVHSIGMGIMHPCRAVATVYDLSVELWESSPFAYSKRNTRYWKVQKRVLKQCSYIICISEATENDLRLVIKKSRFNTNVVYMPVSQQKEIIDKKREPYFITLGGSPHKNLRRVVEAFKITKQDHPEFKLIILGDIDRDMELPDNIPGYICFEDMADYAFHREHASGIIICSLHEGLGIPALESMAYSCPLLLSDIPSLREISENAGYFVDPENIYDIAEGMNKLIKSQKKWIEASGKGYLQYKNLSRYSYKKIAEIYRR